MTDKRKVLLEKYVGKDFPHYEHVIRAAIEYKYGKEAEIVVDVSEGDYQGSSVLICKDNEGKYYYYCYGWGSCSGCDELESREGYGHEGTVHEMVSTYVPTQHENKQACIDYITKEIPNSYDDDLLLNAIKELHKNE